MMSAYDTSTLGSLKSKMQRKIQNAPIQLVTFAPPPPIFPNIVFKLCKGDVMITGRGSGGLVGHAAIMACDDYVLEMPGGDGWQFGIEDNNRLIRKNDWLKLHEEDMIKLYRNDSTVVAHAAADWAYRNYYNSSGGSEKTEHITYRLTNDIWATDPSYCSKLVIQAYHFGNESRDVIRDMWAFDHFIVPSTIPTYFLAPYKLYNVKLVQIFNSIGNFFTR